MAGWTDTLDNDARAYAANKGWDRLDPERASLAILSSYRELERTRPAAPPPPAAYTFDGVKNADGSAPDPEFLGAIRAIASEHKLPTAVADALAAQVIKWGDDAEAADRVSQTTRFTEGETKLKTTWGADYDKNLDLAGRAFNAMGLPKETIDALVGQVGVDTLMAQGLNLGKQMGEATLLRGDTNVGDQKTQSMTREQAVVERNRLTSDTEFGKKIMAGDAEAMKQLETVSRAILGTPENFTPPQENFGRTPTDPMGEKYFTR
jgi:hypothetical protein